MKNQFISTIALSVAAGGFVGWLSHTPRVVVAASDSGPTAFQLQGTGPSSQLGVYYANERDLYVYEGVAAGASSVNCAFKLHIARAGGPLERTNCGLGKRQ